MAATPWANTDFELSDVTKARTVVVKDLGSFTYIAVTDNVGGAIPAAPVAGDILKFTVIKLGEGTGTEAQNPTYSSSFIGEDEGFKRTHFEVNESSKTQPIISSDNTTTVSTDIANIISVSNEFDYKS